jgi:hypothetical protein
MQSRRKTGLILTAIICFFSLSGFAQRDSTLFFRSALSITQNGFSFIPSFSLGKPAVIFEPSIGNKRLSFEPQFRFALEGKPWSFIFIYKYKLINGNKFSLQVGGHIPAIIFSTQSVSRNGATEDVIISQRFLAAELVPNYSLSKDASIGMYFLRGHGFDTGSIKDSYYVGLRSTITNLNITDRLFVKINPQVYYLKTDDKDGLYVTNTLTLAIRNFPLSVSNIINKAIQTDIPGRDFDWNVSLVYSFDKNYVRHKN